jgi:hypothetical protein
MRHLAPSCSGISLVAAAAAPLFFLHVGEDEGEQLYLKGAWVFRALLSKKLKSIGTGQKYGPPGQWALTRAPSGVEC